MTESKYAWIQTYEELASAIYRIRATPEKLTATLSRIFDGTTDLKFPKNAGEPYESSQVDPFTFFASFNRGIADDKRRKIIELACNELGVEAPQGPLDFAGIPLVNFNQNWFFGAKADRGEHDVEGLWDLFNAAIEYTAAPNERTEQAFEIAYDTAASQFLVAWRLTTGLFWIRPSFFMTLDSRSRDYLAKKEVLPENLPLPAGSDYLKILDTIRESLDRPFPEISSDAYEWSKACQNWWPSPAEYDPGLSVEGWRNLLADKSIFDDQSLVLLKRMLDLGGQATCKQLSSKYGMSYQFYQNTAVALAKRIAKATDGRVLKPSIDGRWWPIVFIGKPTTSKKDGDFIWKLRAELEHALNEFPLDNIPLYPTRYWLIAPGENASEWDSFRQEGVIGIGWEALGDPLVYKSKASLKKALSTTFEKPDPKNDAASIWRFTHEIKPGDIVYARKGKNEIVGRGIVESPCRHEPDRERYATIRDVEWTDAGSWTLSGEMQWRTVTEVTSTGKHTPDELEALFSKEGKTDMRSGALKHWWLTANAKIWSFSQINMGEEQSYTLYNEKGNPRRILANFKAARKGDIIVGYETTPTKKIVALCEVVQDCDGKFLRFKKTEDLEEPIPLAAIKADPVLSRCEFCKNPNGSFFKLTDGEFAVLEEMMDSGSPIVAAPSIEPYDDERFLEKVFIDASQLATLKRLLRRKKNLILQGAPGTGKTFAAKRLAYTMMGAKDKSRLEMVQFHQSSTYEDFIIGYRPTDEGGFDIHKGVFLQFCKRAEADPSHDYFFIIDEINRANISKVFGELLLLIEADHRGKPLTLPVGDIKFSVPHNLYIIGMMNTADRGLALIDYALRRRFAFFEMEPALDDKRFLESLQNAGEGAGKLREPVEAVKKLNRTIADDPALGSGFRIGHSYFCVENALTIEGVHEIARFEIEPLIREYWFDDPDKTKTEIGKLEGIFS